ncbi:MAG: multidrug ABC transporter ATP-binding protein [marine bacterium B5-7]|nr:MAG: multidrug ABC transporter ATP-binding protein [marine bacterium B5-7]
MTDALIIDNLCKTYDNGFQALKGISLRVEQGDFFALLGPNGAGKSTTIGILCSLVNKTSGQVKILGHDIDTALSQAKSRVGLVPQEFNFSIFERVQDIVVNQAGYYGVPRQTALARSAQLLKSLGLWDKRNQVARNLSGGMKRRLMIARALVHCPDMLILDEPTAGVDIELRRSMWEFLQGINKQGTTIILTTHYLEEAESLCRNIAIMNHGKVIENTSMPALLQQLDVETFVLDVQPLMSTLASPPDFVLRQINATTLEIDMNKSQHLNNAFAWLSAQGVNVVSMRNKANRLEELFLHLTGDSSPMQAG